MNRSPKRTLIAAALMLVLVDPGVAGAQACVASPAANGQFAVGLGASMSEGVEGYGVDLIGNLRGPFFLGAGASVQTYDRIDDLGLSFGAGAGYELPVAALSICPRVSASYFMLNTETQATNRFGEPFLVDHEVRSLTFPLGLNVGKRWDLEEDVYVVPAVSASFIHIRTSFAAPEIGAEDSETANEFGGGFFATLGWRQFFVDAGISASTIEDSDPVFRLGIGLVAR